MMVPAPALAEPPAAVEETTTVPAPASSEPPPVVHAHEKLIVTRTRRRYAEVQELLAQGHSRALVSRTAQDDEGMNGIARKAGMTFREVATVGPWSDNNVYAISRSRWEETGGP